MRGMDKQILPFASLSQRIQVDEQGWMHLLPAGEFRAKDGRPFDAPYWYTDADIAMRVIARFDAVKTKMVVDYEHQTLRSEQNGKPAPAAGWITALKWVDGLGLFGKVEWTATARAYIEADEYLYQSPVFSYLSNGEVFELYHVALTNFPALDDLDEVVAALSHRSIQQQTEQKTMDKALKELLSQLLGLGNDASESQITAALTLAIDKMTAGKGLAACNMTLDGYIKQQQSVTALSASIGELTPDPTQYVPIGMMAEVQKQVVSLSQKIAEKETKEAEQLVIAALADGRLLPAQKEWADGLIKTNIAALTGFLASAVPVAALTQTQTKGNPPEGQEKQGDLTETELAVCSQLGVSPADFLKTKEAK